MKCRSKGEGTDSHPAAVKPPGVGVNPSLTLRAEWSIRGNRGSVCSWEMGDLCRGYSLASSSASSCFADVSNEITGFTSFAPHRGK